MKQPHNKRKPREQDTAPEKDAAREERKLDEALEESFPASDPPAQTQPHDTSPGGKDAPRKPRPGEKKTSGDR